MFVNDCLNINEKGHLTIGGCDTVELAKEYGTPLYVLDENTIRTTCRSYVESFKSSTTATVCRFMPARRLAVRSFAELQTKSISDLM